MQEQSHTLISLVQDEPGVLTRVAGLFRRRGFNIESLSVGHCERPGLSRMTIVVKGDDAEVEQVTKQLDKLIEVVNVTDITREDVVARELACSRSRPVPTTAARLCRYATSSARRSLMWHMTH